MHFATSARPDQQSPTSHPDAASPGRAAMRSRTRGMSYDQATAALSPDAMGARGGGIQEQATAARRHAANVEDQPIPWDDRTRAIDQLSQLDHLPRTEGESRDNDGVRCSAASLLAGLMMGGPSAVESGRGKLLRLTTRLSRLGQGAGRSDARRAHQVVAAVPESAVGWTYSDAHRFMEAIFIAEIAYETIQGQAAARAQGAEVSTVRFFRDELWAGHAPRGVDIYLVNNGTERDPIGHYVLGTGAMGRESQQTQVVYNPWATAAHGAAYTAAADGTRGQRSLTAATDVHAVPRDRQHMVDTDRAETGAGAAPSEGASLARIITATHQGATAARLAAVEALRAKVSHLSEAEKLRLLNGDDPNLATIERLVPGTRRRLQRWRRSHHLDVTVAYRSSPGYELGDYELSLEYGRGHTTPEQKLEAGHPVRFRIPLRELSAPFNITLKDGGTYESGQLGDTITIGPDYDLSIALAPYRSSAVSPSLAWS